MRRKKGRVAENKRGRRGERLGGTRQGSILQVGSLAAVLKAVKKPGYERIRNYQDD